MLTNKRSRRKASGGRYRPTTKRIVNRSNLATNTKLGESRVKTERTRGGGVKGKMLATNKVNVFDGKKSSITEITNVIETPANRHLVRRNVLTKGAIVETKMGKVKITSRPGQESSVNGVLVK